MATQLLNQVGKILKRCKDRGVVIARRMKKAITKKIERISLRRKLATPDSDTRPPEDPKNQPILSTEQHAVDSYVQSTAPGEGKQTNNAATEDFAYLGSDMKDVQLAQNEDGDVGSSINLGSKRNTRPDIEKALADVEQSFQDNSSVAADNDPSPDSTLPSSTSMRVNASSEELGSSSDHYIQADSHTVPYTQTGNLTEARPESASLDHSSSAPPATWITTIPPSQVAASPAPHQQLQVDTLNLPSSQGGPGPGSAATGQTDHSHSGHGSHHDLSAIGSVFSDAPFEGDLVDE